MRSYTIIRYSSGSYPLQPWVVVLILGLGSLNNGVGPVTRMFNYSLGYIFGTGKPMATNPQVAIIIINFIKSLNRSAVRSPESCAV